MSLTLEDIGVLSSNVTEISLLLNVMNERMFLQTVVGTPDVMECIYAGPTNSDKVKMLCKKMVKNNCVAQYNAFKEYFFDKKSQYEKMCIKFDHACSGTVIQHEIGQSGVQSKNSVIKILQNGLQEIKDTILNLQVAQQHEKIIELNEELQHWRTHFMKEEPTCRPTNTMPLKEFKQVVNAERELRLLNYGKSSGASNKETPSATKIMHGRAIGSKVIELKDILQPCIQVNQHFATGFSQNVPVDIPDTKETVPRSLAHSKISSPQSQYGNKNGWNRADYNQQSEDHATLQNQYFQPSLRKQFVSSRVGSILSNFENRRGNGNGGVNGGDGL